MNLNLMHGQLFCCSERNVAACSANVVLAQKVGLVEVPLQLLIVFVEIRLILIPAEMTGQMLLIQMLRKSLVVV